MSVNTAVKQAALRIARYSGIGACARLLTRQGYNIIGFHGVSLDNEHERFPTFFVSPETLERRLRFIVKHYQVVPLSEVVDQHRRGRIKPNQLVLTFDDGYYNFLGRAVPLLEKYGVHGTVYVVTDEIMSGEPNFTQLIRDMLLSTRKPRVAGLPHRPAAEYAITSRDARERLAKEINIAFQTLCTRSEQRHEFCREVATRVDVDLDAKLRARLWDRLTPAEVAEVTARGFGVQLHTHTHADVVTRRSELRSQVRTNREIVEGLTGKKAVHFCYPSGLWRREVWPDLIAEGIESATTTRMGPNFPETPLLALRRYGTGEAMTQAHFELELSGIRWLAYSLLHPSRRFEPTEKRVPYKVQPELY